MGFVRVSGYSESDLELASFNGICNCEFYRLTGRSISETTDTLTFMFGKDYAWAIIVTGNIDSSAPERSGWHGDSEPYNLAYHNSYSGSAKTKVNTGLPTMILVKDVKKGDYYQGNAAGNTLATISIIACPLDKDEIGTAPDPDYGYFMYYNGNPKDRRAATNYPYGMNFTNNKNGEYGVHWYYPDDDTTPPVKNIPPTTVISASSSSDSGNDSGSGSGGSGGSGGNNDPEDQEDPVNPGDPDGPTGG